MAEEEKTEERPENELEFENAVRTILNQFNHLRGIIRKVNEMGPDLEKLLDVVSLIRNVEEVDPKRIDGAKDLIQKAVELINNFDKPLSEEEKELLKGLSP
jgi:hypothetical protein